VEARAWGTHAYQQAGTLEGGKLWENPGKLRDLGAAAAKLFGWDSDKPAGNTYNTLVVTTEQLQQIRALREQTDAQESPSDTPGCP
jgi:hypothetical protein